MSAVAVEAIPAKMTKPEAIEKAEEIVRDAIPPGVLEDLTIECDAYGLHAEYVAGRSQGREYPRCVLVVLVFDHEVSVGVRCAFGRVPSRFVQALESARDSVALALGGVHITY